MKRLTVLAFVFIIAACESSSVINLKYAEMLIPKGWTVSEKGDNYIELIGNIQGEACLISLEYNKRKGNYDLEEQWAMMKPPYIRTKDILNVKVETLNGNKWMAIEYVDVSDNLHSMYSFTIVNDSIFTSQYIATDKNYRMALQTYLKFLDDIKFNAENSNSYQAG